MVFILIYWLCFGARLGIYLGNLCTKHDFYFVDIESHWFLTACFSEVWFIQSFHRLRICPKQRSCAGGYGQDRTVTQLHRRRTKPSPGTEPMGPPTAPQACSAACRPKLQKQEREQHAHITIFHYHCDHLDIPIALTDQTGQGPGLQSWFPRAMCCRNTTRRASTRRSSCRGSTMTGRRGCITTGIGITIRWWGLYQSGSDWVGRRG